MQLTPTSKETARQEKDAPTWSPRIVYIRAAIAQLDTPYISFLVAKENPLSNLDYDQQARLLYFRQEDSAQAIRDRWNAPFQTLPDSQRYFLVAWSSVAGISPRVTALAGLSFGIATPGPYYKRWITTAAMERRGELVAWCEEVSMLGIQEEVIEVEFTEERMIRLLSSQANEHSSKVA